MRLRAFALCLSASASLLVACFSPEQPSCAFRCGSGGACPDDYSCGDDNYCHLKGSTEKCPFTVADLTTTGDAPRPDMLGDATMLADMTGDAVMPADMTGDMTPPPGDMVMVPDMVVVPDMTMLPDMTVVPDMTMVSDMVVVPDMTMVPDLTQLPDLTMLPDLSCVSSTCINPPTGMCADPTHLYAAQGMCMNGMCVYGPGMACDNGCYQGMCNGAGPSFAGDAVGAGATFVKVANLGTSTGMAPAGMEIVVTVPTMPHGGVKSLTLQYTTNDFTSTTPLAMSFQSESGANDLWTATIPMQSAGALVRFYLQMAQYTGGDLYDPGNNVNYTYNVQ